MSKLREISREAALEIVTEFTKHLKENTGGVLKEDQFNFDTITSTIRRHDLDWSVEGFYQAVNAAKDLLIWDAKPNVEKQKQAEARAKADADREAKARLGMTPSTSREDRMPSRTLADSAREKEAERERKDSPTFVAPLEPIPEQYTSVALKRMALDEYKRLIRIYGLDRLTARIQGVN